MPENRKNPKTPNTYERGSQVPSQKKTPKMPTVKPPASNSGSKGKK